MDSEIDTIKRWEPQLAKSGVSIDFGPVRIRMEAAGTLELRQYIARRIAIALSLCRGMENTELEGGDTRKAIQKKKTSTRKGRKT